MPLYVYACPSCGTRFERLIPMSRADEAQTCQDCGTPHTQRAITAAATVGANAAPTAHPATPRSRFT